MSDNIYSSGASSSELFNQSLVEQNENLSESKIQLTANMQDASAAKMTQVEPEDQSAMAQSKKSEKADKLAAPRKIEKVFRPFQVFTRKGESDGYADEFTKRHPQYHLNNSTLSALAFEDLGLKFNEDSEPQDIINIVWGRMSTGVRLHPSLLDKGLEFLEEVVQKQVDNAIPNTEEHTRLLKLKEKLTQTKEFHYASHLSRIKTGAGIVGVTDEVVKELDLPFEETFNRYTDLVHNSADFRAVLKTFDGMPYADIKKELKRLRYIINDDIKKHKENAELIQMGKAVRKMQAADHVFLEALNQYKTFLKGYLKSNDLIDAAPAA